MYIKSAASRFPVIVFDLCSFYRLVCSLVVQDLGFYTRSRFLVASLLGMTKPLLLSALLCVLTYAGGAPARSLRLRWKIWVLHWNQIPRRFVSRNDKAFTSLCVPCGAILSLSWLWDGTYRSPFTVYRLRT